MCMQLVKDIVEDVVAFIVEAFEGMCDGIENALLTEDEQYYILTEDEQYYIQYE